MGAKITVSAESKSGRINLEIDRYPDECPFCHHGIEPTLMGGFFTHPWGESKLYLTFFCPRQSCSNFFVGEYRPGYPLYEFSRTLLGVLKSKEFSEIISGISPDFKNIYFQAELAEAVALTEICGTGYRKALEFLIKDYIISKGLAPAERIENLFLGKCIQDYITNDRIKHIAKRAAWLGNDETHYVRKWLDKNISDLKQLIDLTVHWMEAEDLSDKIMAEMPD